MQVQWKPVALEEEDAPQPSQRWGATLSTVSDSQARPSSTCAAAILS